MIPILTVATLAVVLIIVLVVAYHLIGILWLSNAVRITLKLWLVV